MKEDIALDWYTMSRQTIQRRYPKDWRKFIGYLAVTSVNATVKANLTLAKKALRQDHQGENFTGYTQQVITNLERIKTGQPIAGPKVSAFYAALLGDKFAVVVDRWMARAYGYDHVTPKNFPVIHCSIIRESEENNMYPAEYQAQLWAEVRGAGESFSSLLNEGGN